LDTDNGENNKERVTKKKRREPATLILAKCTEDGQMEVILPTDSLWYVLYVSAPNISSKKIQKKFHCQFRMPHSSFVDLIADARAGNWFPQWMGTNAANKPSSLLELLILGSFWYLGQGWTFDDCEEFTAILEEVHRVFFHHFITVGSTVLFDRYVVTPKKSDDLKQHMEEFEMAGLPGACAPTDATSIIHKMCSHRL
jgi:hypothetical protein